MSNCCSDRTAGFEASPLSSDSKSWQSILVSSLEKVVICKEGANCWPEAKGETSAVRAQTRELEPRHDGCPCFQEEHRPRDSPETRQVR